LEYIGFPCQYQSTGAACQFTYLPPVVLQSEPLTEPYNNTLKQEEILEEIGCRSIPEFEVLPVVSVGF
jgi:hypothetical protein